MGNEDMIRELLAHEAKFDVADKYGNTPLHLACQSGCVGAVLALLGPGMRHTLRFKNRDGQTPLHVAVLVGTKETVHELISAGARIDTKDKVNVWVERRREDRVVQDGHTPLDLISAEQSDLIQALSVDANSDSSTEQKRTSFSRNPSPMTPRGRPKAQITYDNQQHQIPSAKTRRMKHLSSSPEKGYAKYNDVTQRSLPRKQLQLHEMAIQV